MKAIAQRILSQQLDRNVALQPAAAAAAAFSVTLQPVQQPPATATPIKRAKAAAAKRGANVAAADADFQQPYRELVEQLLELCKHVPHSSLQQQCELVASSSTAVQQALQVAV
jgi:hypothetical protein